MDQLRDEFEQWYASEMMHTHAWDFAGRVHYLKALRQADSYKPALADLRPAWAGFKASRKEALITLPRWSCYDDASTAREVIDHCREAIGEAGFRTE